MSKFQNYKQTLKSKTVESKFSYIIRNCFISSFKSLKIHGSIQISKQIFIKEMFFFKYEKSLQLPFGHLNKLYD